MSEKKINVFLIDDSADDTFYVKDIISENDRIGSVTVFNDSEESLKVIIERDKNKEALPDLILLDVRMPELDGFEWIDEVDQLFSAFTPVVVMLTSSKHRKDVESFEKQFVGKELLAKPLEKEKFDVLIEKYF